MSESNFKHIEEPALRMILVGVNRILPRSKYNIPEGVLNAKVLEEMGEDMALTMRMKVMAKELSYEMITLSVSVAIPRTLWDHVKMWLNYKIGSNFKIRESSYEKECKYRVSLVEPRLRHDGGFDKRLKLDCVLESSSEGFVDEQDALEKKKAGLDTDYPTL